MKTNEINIRDPFILTYEGKYYMYGTRGANTWDCTDKSKLGFDVYVSEDLENWSAPQPIFECFDGFWGDRQYWAPEVHYYNGKFYLFATFKNENVCRGTAILVCDTPNGRFVEHSRGAVTPREWECLDGTLYIEDGVPYIVFCHEWVQIGDGEVCALRLTDDLKEGVGEPIILWHASTPSWRDDIRNNGSYVTDGPFHIKEADGLVFMWSSFSKGEYVEALARSDNGKINGNFTIDEKLLFDKNGGHGMTFTDLDGNMLFVFHSPNETPNERPCMRKVTLDMFKEQ